MNCKYKLTKNGKSIFASQTKDLALNELKEIMQRCTGTDEIFIADERSHEDIVGTIEEYDFLSDATKDAIRSARPPFIIGEEYEIAAQIQDDGFTYKGYTYKIEELELEQEQEREPKEAALNEKDKYLGAELAIARKAAGYSVREYAAMCGINSGNLYKIESGKYNVSIAIMNSVLAPLKKKLAIVDDK